MWHRAFGSRANRYLSRCCQLLLLACSLEPVLAAQSGGVGFWEPDAHQEAFMLRAPVSDQERFSTLRSDFIRFGCTSGHLLEQPAGLEDERSKSATGNLVCSLPGRYPLQVIVAATYPRKTSTEPSSGWAEAVLVPILYHALHAQVRSFTWVFADLRGPEGERAFLETLQRQPAPQPVAFIELDELGTGVPHVWTSGPKSERQVREILDELALHLAQLQGFGNSPAYATDTRRPDSTSLADDPSTASGRIPLAVVYSEAGPAVTRDLFHQDFEFLAFYLCGLDVKLNPLSGTAD